MQTEEGGSTSSVTTGALPHDEVGARRFPRESRIGGVTT